MRTLITNKQKINIHLVAETISSGMVDAIDFCGKLVIQNLLEVRLLLSLFVYLIEYLMY